MRAHRKHRLVAVPAAGDLIYFMAMSYIRVGEGFVTKMLIDIDEEALEAAADLLGTTTKKDTVNTSLRETAQRLRRAQALAKLAERGQAGDFDELLDKPTYR